MITVEEIGNKAAYKAVLAEIKKGLPLNKRLFKRNFSREEAFAVRTLYFEKMEVADLEFLKFFPNLEELRMERVHGISDMNGLKNCPKLKMFEATDCVIPDLKSVVYCKELIYFAYVLYDEYKQYGKSDFSFLQELKELKTVCIRGNMLKDASVMSNLHRVEHLILDDNPISTIASLKTMKSLHQLEVEDCDLTCLEDIGEFPALKTVFAEGNLFTEEQKKKYCEEHSLINIDFGD